MLLDALENMLGTLFQASSILVYDLPLPYEECWSWFYCPEITLGSSCKTIPKKWKQESKKAHDLLTQKSHLKCSSPVLKNFPYTLFDTPYQVFLYNLLLRLPSSEGILTSESFNSSLLLCSPPVTRDKLNLSSPFSCAYSEMFHFFTPRSIYF